MDCNSIVTDLNLPTFTLLIVEDLPANREVYRQCLLGDLSCAYDLLEAESVAEGLELCNTKSIDAILLVVCGLNKPTILNSTSNDDNQVAILWLFAPPSTRLCST